MKKNQNNDIINFLKSKKTSNSPNYNTGKNVSTPFTIKKLEETYCFGKCMYLAIALKERFGYKINLNIGKFGGETVIEHAWNVIDNKDFDIEGFFNANEVEILGKQINNVSKEFIYNLLEKSTAYDDFSPKNFHKQVSDAHKLIDNYLIHAYPNINKRTKKKLQLK